MGLEIRDLSVVFKNGVTAVSGVDLRMDKGIYGLLGENGAGKTTLMRVLTTILKPTRGTAELGGLTYEEHSYEAIQKKIGYLPQELNLYPDLTVGECLEYMGELAGITKNVCRRRIDYYLEKTSLQEHRRKKMKQLSGGMKRRVGLIQAMLNNPEFLIVDEPTTGLDPEERIRIRNLLVEFAEERMVLFSTHVVEDLAATCSQLAVMQKGEFIYSGSVRELLNQAAGHIWIAEIADEAAAGQLERKYQISSKQYTEKGMRIKIISAQQPQESCRPGEITLEDAYMCVMNRKRQNR